MRSNGNRGQFRYFRLQMAQVNLANLERFQRAVGGGRISGPYQHKNKTHTPYYNWTADKDAFQIARKLLPILGEEKKQQIILAMEADMKKVKP